MGYQIQFDASGNPEMSFELDDTIASDMALSIMVKKGSWFLRPDFGLPELPRKITEETLPLVKQRIEQALKWLIDTGKAKSISVLVERDDDPWRVDVNIQAVQANNLIVSFDTFVEVV